MKWWAWVLLLLYFVGVLGFCWGWWNLFFKRSAK